MEGQEAGVFGAALENPWVREGLLRHGRGLLEEASACYRRAHGHGARDAEALLLEGIAARQQGEFARAVELTEEAIALRPELAHYRMNLGLALEGAGRLDEAKAALLEALALDPRAARAWCALGELAERRGGHEAAACYRRAAEADPSFWQARRRAALLAIGQRQFEEALTAVYAGLRLTPQVPELWLTGAVAAEGASRLPQALGYADEAIRLRAVFPEAWLVRGNVLWAMGRTLEAALAFERAAQLRPGYGDALCNLIPALLKLGRAEEAARCAELAVACDAGRAAAHHLLGTALVAAGDLDRAEEALREAVQLDGERAEYWNTLGGALIYRKPAAEAEECFRRVIRLKPEYSKGHVNLGTALKLLGRTKEMRAEYELGLALDPESAGARYNLALADLREGGYREGWAGHEWRWKFRELKPKLRHFRQPLWRGEELAGKTILLYAEQGYGDTIQFVRYVPLVLGRGGRVVLEVQRAVARLVGSVAGVDQVVARGEQLPEFDVQCPLMSLPWVFGTEVETIPSATPYLAVEPEAVDAARARFPGEGLRVGMVWAGNPRLRNDRARSIPVEKLDPLTRVSGVSLFSLQKETSACLDGMHDAGTGFGDFADTAAMVRTLDLVVSVDTAVAHLAGALGVPVWVLLPERADWRWLEEREDSPWYPSARLFRQRMEGDWDEVVERVCEAVRRLARGDEGV
jgi:tetratricopeptide (TPR) repeat protein